MPYSSLNPDKIVQTLDALANRIDERFGGRGLCAVAREVRDVARRDQERAQNAGKPYVLVRIGVTVLIVTGLGLLLAPLVARIADLDGVLAFMRGEASGGLNVLSGVEAAVNLLVLFGAGVFFLTTAEERIKRRSALKDLHELRSLAHVVDMHQLTKDPTVVLGAERTASSPERTMNEFELTRYLDYSAEMLSLIGKVAALYAENMRDPVIINTVNDIEALTTNLARKIWQKIMIIRRLDEEPQEA